MRFLTFLLICCLIAALCSCTRSYGAIEPKEQVMIRVSKWHELDWKYRDSSFVRVAYNPDLLPIRDTTVFPITCPLSGIEIRYYKIQ